MNRTKFYLPLLALMAFSAPYGHAGKGDKGMPPPEALAACEGLGDGAACEFQGRRGDALEGTCRLVPAETLACVPKNHRRREEGNDEFSSQQ